MGEPIKWSLRAVRDGVWAEVPIDGEILSSNASAIIPSAMLAATEQIEETPAPPGFVWVVEWGDEIPGEVDSLWVKESDARAKAAKLNAEVGDDQWKASRWLVNGSPG